MKYLDEYRDQTIAAKIVDEIKRTVTKPWVLMEVCGGQTHSIVKYGLDYLLPQGSRTGARPGMPGMRDAARNDRPRARHRAPPGRDLLLLRRYAARARLARRSVSSRRPKGRMSAWSTLRSIA